MFTADDKVHFSIFCTEISMPTRPHFDCILRMIVQGIQNMPSYLIYVNGPFTSIESLSRFAKRHSHMLDSSLPCDQVHK